MKVAELVVTQAAHGWSPEELHFQFPHLTLGQLHSALAYHWDHQDELDRDIARRLATAEHQQRQAPPSPPRDRLRGRGAVRHPDSSGGLLAPHGRLPTAEGRGDGRAGYPQRTDS